uniref:ER membrane protein complex subunit 6 n=1 Tax=Panagrellus redivivus TaxID=6233 RepID=A0A7E4VV75_PANRE
MVEKKQAATSSDKRDAVYSEAAIRNNFGILEYSRTCQAAAGGIASGALGLTGTYGFLFYFVTVFLQAVFWEYKAGFKWQDFFAVRNLSISHSLVGGLLTYVLFWVFIYGIVYVY